MGTSTARPLLLRRQESFTQTSPTEEISPRSIETLVNDPADDGDVKAQTRRRSDGGGTAPPPLKQCTCSGRIKTTTLAAPLQWFSSSLVIFQPQHTPKTQLQDTQDNTSHLKKTHHTSTHLQIVHQTLHTHLTRHTFCTSFTYFLPDVSSTSTHHTKSTQSPEYPSVTHQQRETISETEPHIQAIRELDEMFPKQLTKPQVQRKLNRQTKSLTKTVGKGQTTEATDALSQKTKTTKQYKTVVHHKTEGTLQKPTYSQTPLQQHPKPRRKIEQNILLVHQKLTEIPPSPSRQQMATEIKTELKQQEPTLPQHQSTASQQEISPKLKATPQFFIRPYRPPTSQQHAAFRTATPYKPATQQQHVAKEARALQQQLQNTSQHKETEKTSDTLKQYSTKQHSEKVQRNTQPSEVEHLTDKEDSLDAQEQHNTKEYRDIELSDREHYTDMVGQDIITLHHCEQEEHRKKEGAHCEAQQRKMSREGEKHTNAQLSEVTEHEEEEISEVQEQRKLPQHINVTEHKEEKNNETQKERKLPQHSNTQENINRHQNPIIQEEEDCTPAQDSSDTEADQQNNTHHHQQQQQRSDTSHSTSTAHEQDEPQPNRATSTSTVTSTNSPINSPRDQPTDTTTDKPTDPVTDSYTDTREGITRDTPKAGEGDDQADTVHKDTSDTASQDTSGRKAKPPSSSRQERMTTQGHPVTSVRDARPRRNTPTQIVTPLRHHLTTCTSQEEKQSGRPEEKQQEGRENAEDVGHKNEGAVALSHRPRHSPDVDSLLYCPTRLFKVVFIGDSGVGKTTFIHRASTGEYRRDFGSTVGVDYRTVEVQAVGVVAVLQLWDTAGQERFRSITRQYYRNADCVVVMYDLTNEQSFLSVVDWISSVREAGSDGVMVAVVGNKEEMREQKKVDVNEANRLAKTHKCYVCECSAAVGSSVQEVLSDLTSLLLSGQSLTLQMPSRTPAISLSQPRAAARTCCKS